MKKFWTFILSVLAILSVVLAVIYLTHTANALPSFLPGHLKGSTHKHTKHAIAFIGLAIIFAIGAWMVSGNKEQTSPSPKN